MRLWMSCTLWQIIVVAASANKRWSFLADVCRTEGIAALHLEVERANTIAQEVYRKQGFKDHDRYLLTKWI